MIKGISIVIAYIITVILYVIFYPIYIISMLVRIISSTTENFFKLVIDKIGNSLHEESKIKIESTYEEE